MRRFAGEVFVVPFERKEFRQKNHFGSRVNSLFLTNLKCPGLAHGS